MVCLLYPVAAASYHSMLAVQVLLHSLEPAQPLLAVRSLINPYQGLGQTPKHQQSQHALPGNPNTASAKQLKTTEY
jgi:hypothetical protein